MNKLLQTLLNDPALTYTNTLQDLWSGYGEIARYFSPKLNASVIVKSVSPPEEVDHPRGWHSSIGHSRKLTSYKIEAFFYQHYAQHCPPACYVPKMIAFSSSPLASASQTLVMEDLIETGFNDSESTLSLSDIKIVIHWLAHFHGRFLGNAGKGLWPIGSYWYLETRQDEYNVMQAGPLKQAADLINNALNNAYHQTLIHGDAKLANFCFGAVKETKGSSKKYQAIDKSFRRVAAVDFQYVGRGIGVKDLAYFLGSCLTDTDLTMLHDELLNEYFTALRNACNDYGHNVDFIALEKEWRELYAFSCADFHRFLLGWSPEHDKINTYLQTQTNKALQSINASLAK